VRAGKTDKAEAAYRRIIEKSPGCAPALHALGLMVRARGQIARAVQLLERAADAVPDDPAIQCDLGLALKAAGRHDEAIERLVLVATLLAPHAPEAHANLGIALKAAGRWAEAINAFTRAVALRPNDPELRYNLGNGLLAADRATEAETEFRRAIELDPSHMRARINLGAALKERGNADAAIRCFEGVTKGTASERDASDAEWNLGLVFLAQGRWRDGWRHYEARRRLAGFALRHFPNPAWSGEPLASRTLLVHAEQGLGDTIQFLRYLPLLRDRGVGAVFLPQPELRPLLARVTGLPPVVADAPPQVGAEVPLLSLPHCLGLAEPLVPGNGVYLPTDPIRTDRWRARLPAGERLIGIAWQGSPSYRNDGRRSIPLEAFAPLAALPGVRLVCLQKDHGANQLDRVAWRDRVVQFGDERDREGAFVDTSAIIGALDLVVTSDTSVAHLAGALGSPVWVALSDRPDWRWGAAGDWTPWYPSMRLYRQSAPGDWAGVFARIAAAISG
jgi:Flp pilus assembly protein TadD